MKRHTSLMLIAGLCLLALFSCTPVEFPETLQRTPVVDKPNIYITPHAKTAEVSFTPVRNADSYSVILHNIETATTEAQSVPMKVIDGLWSFKLNKLTPDKPYILTVKAENDIGFKESSLAFKTKEDTGELEYAPIAYMEGRSENKVAIAISRLNGIQYRITLNNNGVPITAEIPEIGFDGNNNKIVTTIFEGLDAKSRYTVKIEHKKVSKSYSTYATELTIPEFRANFAKDLAIEFSKSENTVSVKKLAIEGMSPTDLTGMKFMSLLFYPDGSGIPTILDTVEIKDGVFKMEINNLNGLRSGLFDIVITKDKGADPIYTQPKYYTTPVIPSKDINASNQQSVTLTWTQPEGIEDIIYTISGESEMHNGKVWKITPSEVEVVGNQATLKLDDLVSNTKYHLTIEAELPNEEHSTSTYEFTTDSFAGIYRWVSPSTEGKVSSFVIEVWDEKIATEKIEAKEWNGKWNSDFPYHVFVHESDPAYTDAMKGVPIMPLFQSNDEIPAGTISYANGNNHYQVGYRWNEAKWNTTTQKPSKWKPNENVIEGDKITSFCDSWPFIGQVSTKTEFTFQVTDGKPQLRFRNAGDGPKAGFVNLGLFSNPSPTPGTDKFTFILDRIGSVESKQDVKEK